VKEFLSQNEVKHTYVEITKSMGNLGTFLKYRDNHASFKEIKEKGRIGLPCIIINDGEKIIFGMPELSDLL